MSKCISSIPLHQFILKLIHNSQYLWVFWLEISRNCRGQEQTVFHTMVPIAFTNGMILFKNLSTQSIFILLA